MSDTVLACRGLTKTYGMDDVSVPVLRGIDFDVRRGESVAIVGASGSGKSTLLGLMAGLDVPSEGRVVIEGEDLFALDEDARAELRSRKLGFVFQSFQLLGNRTALENVMLPLELAGLPNARSAAAEVLAQVNLSPRREHYPRQLSGGEQQRVAIARAFVTRPALLFADEPTGNLDSVTGERIIDLLFDLNKATQTTLVVVTHDQAIAQRCSRIIKIEAGRLVT